MAQWDAWDQELRAELAIPGAGDNLASDVNNLDSDLTLPTTKFIEELLQEVGTEEGNAHQFVYLGTVSRVLPDTLTATDLVDISGMARSELSAKVRRAFEDPIVELGRPGRRRDPEEGGVIEKIVVAREQHTSGEIHFHFAVKTFKKQRFLLPKRTLRQREGIASHWSCSHTQWWSALRYLVVPTEKKAEVDESLDVWTWNGQPLDLFAEAQEPWMAKVWKRRRECKEIAAAAGANKKRKFTKLDLTSLILDKGLHSKAALLEFTLDHGSASMQMFVHQQQGKLKEFLEHAAEWGGARKAAAEERQTDWELVQSFGAAPCKLGSNCSYTGAANRIFEANHIF